MNCESTSTRVPKVRLTDHVAGDTFLGIPTIGPIEINETVPPYPAQYVRLDLCAAGAKEPSFRFRSAGSPDAGDAPITIVDAATWEFSIPRVGFADFVLSPGEYEGHIEITDTVGERLTTHQVQLCVLDDKTD